MTADEQLFQHRPDLVILPPEKRGQRPDDILLGLRVDLMIDKETIQLSADKTRDLVAGKDHIEQLVQFGGGPGPLNAADDGVAIKRGELLISLVMPVVIERSAIVLIVDRIAGEDPRGGLHIRFGIMRTGSFADGKQFLQLAAIVLIRRLFGIGISGQITEHRRFGGHGARQLPEITQRMLPEKAVIAIAEKSIVDIIALGDEVVMPEEDHFFAQGPVLVDHQPQPPGLEGVAAAIVVHAVVFRR